MPLLSYDVLVHRYGPLGVAAPPLFGNEGGSYYSDAERASIRKTTHDAGAPFRILGSGARQVAHGFRDVFRPPAPRDLSSDLTGKTDEELAMDYIHFADPPGMTPPKGTYGGDYEPWGRGTWSILDHRCRW